MIRVALAVYCLSKYSKDRAMEFAMQARRRRRVQVPEDEEEREECPIRQWFLDANLDDVATVFMPETQYESAIRIEAVKFLAERQTVLNGSLLKISNMGKHRQPSAWCPIFLPVCELWVLIHLFGWTLQEQGVVRSWDAQREDGAKRCGHNGGCGGEVWQRPSP